MDKVAKRTLEKREFIMDVRTFVTSENIDFSTYVSYKK